MECIQCTSMLFFLLLSIVVIKLLTVYILYYRLFGLFSYYWFACWFQFNDFLEVALSTQKNITREVEICCSWASFRINELCYRISGRLWFKWGLEETKRERREEKIDRETARGKKTWYGERISKIEEGSREKLRKI